MSLQCKLAASSAHGDFEVCFNLLQTCFTLALLSCQTCCKLADLQCMSAASLLQTKIAIWGIMQGTLSEWYVPLVGDGIFNQHYYHHYCTTTGTENLHTYTPTTHS
ncbi:hypothetical protein AVEN_60561-1 [Araneus ventricosus]|uniref:Uncharacterized protein n=1 Tax=Araneus ventricosus TaxID=182803 RepID=A0A4Y2F091_ARAVE|nr:hypothetical protein AVEN_60561-1 [Araneus ventricosus]